MNIFNNKKELVTLFIVYSFANILFLLNYDGIYWDDLVLVNNSYQTIHSMFNQATGGLDLTTPFHASILYFEDAVWLYRLIVFLSFFFSGIFLLHILNSIKFINNSDSFIIVLIYLLVPVNSAKIALINSPASFFMLFFFIAFYLFVKDIKNNLSIKNRVLLYILFVISFFVSSIFIFYALILLYALYYTILMSEQFNFFNICKRYIYKYFDFILLPIIFFIIKSKFFTPYGLYENYNKINFDLLNIIELLFISVQKSLYEPIINAIDLSMHSYLSLLFFIFLFFIFKKVPIKFDKLYIYIIFVFLGILSFILSVFPYIIVGKIPELGGWESRHQLLVPLGISLILFYSIKPLYLINKSIINIIFSILISSFIIQNLYNGYKYNMDNFYMKSMEIQFRNSTIIKNNSTFVATLDFGDNLANGRTISFYEFGGRLKKAFAEDSKLIVTNIDDIKEYSKYRDHKQYNFSKWIYAKPIFIHISINKNIHLENKFMLFYYYVFNKEKFNLKIINLVEITKDSE